MASEMTDKMPTVIAMTKSGIQVMDIPAPDPETMCLGGCNGTGIVLTRLPDTDKGEKVFQGEECAACGGTGKRN